MTVCDGRLAERLCRFLGLLLLLRSGVHDLLPVRLEVEIKGKNSQELGVFHFTFFLLLAAAAPQRRPSGHALCFAIFF